MSQPRRDVPRSSDAGVIGGVYLARAGNDVLLVDIATVALDTHRSQFARIPLAVEAHYTATMAA